MVEFHWGFFPSAPWSLQVAGFVSFSCGVYEAKENQGIHGHVIPQIRRFLIGLLSSLHLSESVGLEMVLPVMSRDFSCPLQEE